MKRIPIHPTQSQIKALQKTSDLCRELWNMTLTQRRNKYSWGKTNLETHEQELHELKIEFPQYQLPHHQVLMNVFIAVEEAYQYFMPRRRQKGVKPPAFKTESEFYTQRYSADSFQFDKAQLRINYAQQWLHFEVPENDYSQVTQVELGYDGKWWVELKIK